MDPLDFLSAVLRRPRLDPHQQHSAAAAPPSASSATDPHLGGGAGAGAGAAAFPMSAPFVATGGTGKTGEEASRPAGPFVCILLFIHRRGHQNPYGTGGGAAALPSSSSSSAAAMALKLAADLLDRDQPGLLEGALEVRNDETN